MHCINLIIFLQNKFNELLTYEEKMIIMRLNKKMYNVMINEKTEIKPKIKNICNSINMIEWLEGEGYKIDNKYMKLVTNYLVLEWLIKDKKMEIVFKTYENISSSGDLDSLCWLMKNDDGYFKNYKTSSFLENKYDKILQNAAKSGNIEMIEYIILLFTNDEEYYYGNEEDDDERPSEFLRFNGILSIAIENDHLNVVKWYLENKYSDESEDDSIIDYALSEGRDEIFRYMYCNEKLCKKCDIYINDVSLCYIAIKTHNKKIIEWVIDMQERNESNKKYCTDELPLLNHEGSYGIPNDVLWKEILCEKAIELKELDMLKWVIEKGYKCRDKDDCIKYAKRRKLDEIVEYLENI